VRVKITLGVGAKRIARARYISRGTIHTVAADKRDDGYIDYSRIEDSWCQFYVRTVLSIAICSSDFGDAATAVRVEGLQK
jgi:hypothetical protein